MKIKLNNRKIKDRQKEKNKLNRSLSIHIWRPYKEIRMKTRQHWLSKLTSSQALSHSSLKTSAVCWEESILKARGEGRCLVQAGHPLKGNGSEGCCLNNYIYNY